MLKLDLMPVIACTYILATLSRQTNQQDDLPAFSKIVTAAV